MGGVEAHLAMLRARGEVSTEEEKALRGAISEVRKIPDNKTLIRRGEELNVCILLLDGWMARARDMQSGRRQVTEVHIAGDFPDLHGFTLKRLDHDIVTLSPCRIGIVPHENVRRITEDFPHLARLYWFLTNIDAAIHRERMVSLACRSSSSRLAHFLCEIFYRLQIAGETRGNSFDLPLSQPELAEVLGITTVHMNRTIQELRREGYISFDSRVATILDWPRLVELAEFDPFYLYYKPSAFTPPG